jgi:hypothetical protein
MLTIVAAMTGALNAMGLNRTGVAVAAEPQTLATSPAAPVSLGAGPVTVTLASPPGKALSANVASVAPDRKIYLVAKGLGTDAPPETIYQLYLGLPAGTVPSPDGPYYVGALNFFNAVGRGAGSDPRFLSFDVTALIKSLHAQSALAGNETVTIVPAGKPRAGAQPVVSAISLVAQ